MTKDKHSITVEGKKPRDPNRDVLRNRKPGTMKDRREERGGARNRNRDYQKEE